MISLQPRAPNTQAMGTELPKCLSHAFKIWQRPNKPPAKSLTYHKPQVTLTESWFSNVYFQSFLIIWSARSLLNTDKKITENMLIFCAPSSQIYNFLIYFFLYFGMSIINEDCTASMKYQFTIDKWIQKFWKARSGIVTAEKETKESVKYPEGTAIQNTL